MSDAPRPLADLPIALDAMGGDRMPDAAIDGVPGTHAPVPLEFRDTAGSSCGGCACYCGAGC